MKAGAKEGGRRIHLFRRRHVPNSVDFGGIFDPLSSDGPRDQRYSVEIIENIASISFLHLAAGDIVQSIALHCSYIFCTFATFTKAQRLCNENHKR